MRERWDTGSTASVFAGEELGRRHSGLLDSILKMTPEELDDLENRWRLAMQFLERVPACCEDHRRELGICLGWHSFSNDDLERFCLEILRKPVRIVDES